MKRVQPCLTLTQNPQISLTKPEFGTKVKVGERLRVEATGTNLHHIALFVNDEWVATRFGNSNTSTISFEYEYKIPSAGIYAIQVKGRNVPGSSGGTLVESGFVETGLKYGEFKVGTEVTPESEAAIRDKKLSDESYKSKQLKYDFSLADIREAFYLQNILDRATANAYTGIVIRMPDAAHNLQRFLDNTGGVQSIEFKRMIEESPSTYESMVKDVNEAIEAAENLSIDQQTMHMVTVKEIVRDASDIRNFNWWFAIGGYRTWTKASVYRNGDAYTMFMQYNMRDLYDWNDKEWQLGGFTFDPELFKLHEYGMAQHYLNVGYVDIEVTWKRGQRYGDAIVRLKD
jgi:hypothetical protein